MSQRVYSLRYERALKCAKEAYSYFAGIFSRENKITNMLLTLAWMDCAIKSLGKDRIQQEQALHPDLPATLEAIKADQKAFEKKIAVELEDVDEDNIIHVDFKTANAE